MRAAKRKREADTEYGQPISARPGSDSSHREIAAAAQVSHGTVRAILTSGSAVTDNGAASRSMPLLFRDGTGANSPSSIIRRWIRASLSARFARRSGLVAGM